MIFHLYDMTVMNTSLIFLGLPYFGFLYETYDLHDDASTRFFSYFKVNKKHLYAGVKDGRIIHRRQNGGEGMLVANRNTIKAFKMAVEFSAPPLFLDLLPTLTLYFLSLHLLYKTLTITIIRLIWNLSLITKIKPVFFDSDTCLDLTSRDR